MKLIRTIALVIALLMAFAMFQSLAQAQGATFTVNSTNDVDDGTCDATHCSLREAITAANANSGTDTIEFNIAGAGPHSIQPTSTLPTITDPVIIDGYTQPGASPNTNGPGLSLNTVLKIELDGVNAAAGAIGLIIAAGDSTVRGLAINRFSGGGEGIRSAGANVIEGNFIGTDVTGTVNLGNTFGIVVENASATTIGGTVSGVGNLIAGNVDGVLIIGADATANLIQGNFIGTDVSGAVALGNGDDGVQISDAPNNTIGGTTAGGRNVISGNNQNGVRIDGTLATGNLVQGNFIGTDVTGTADLGNTQNGVKIFLSAANNLIGGTASGAGNVISGNNSDGVKINGSGTTGNQVQGNFIGTDVTGAAALGNFSGVVIDNSPDNTIGGIVTAARNVISGNGAVGIEIMDSGSTGNLIQGNLIGTQVDATSPLGNNSHGVLLPSIVKGGTAYFANNNTIGGTASGTSNTIAFNSGSGLKIFGGLGNAVLSNAIFANGGVGINLGGDGPTPNDTGDADAGANNLQNFPELRHAFINVGGDLVIAYLVDSTTSSSALPTRTEFSVPDADGEEGKTFIGSHVRNDFAPVYLEVIPGNAAALGVAEGDLIVATATDANSNTSEFSASVSITVEATPAPTPTPVPSVSQWGLIIMAGLMAVILLWLMRRSRSLGTA